MGGRAAAAAVSASGDAVVGVTVGATDGGEVEDSPATGHWHGIDASASALRVCQNLEDHRDLLVLTALVAFFAGSLGGVVARML